MTAEQQNSALLEPEQLETVQPEKTKSEKLQLEKALPKASKKLNAKKQG